MYTVSANEQRLHHDAYQNAEAKDVRYALLHLKD